MQHSRRQTSLINSLRKHQISYVTIYLHRLTNILDHRQHLVTGLQASSYCKLMQIISERRRRVTNETVFHIVGIQSTFMTSIKSKDRSASSVLNDPAGRPAI